MAITIADLASVTNAGDQDQLLVRQDGVDKNITISTLGTKIISSVPFANLTGKPTTVSGYGITDVATVKVDVATLADSATAVAWTGITSKPTTVLGYGITDVATVKVDVAKKVEYTLTNGAHLTGAVFDGSSAVTFAVDAASANEAGKVVVRDANGDFASNTITTMALMPDMTGSTGVFSIAALGSPTARFATAYINDLHLGANTLYVNGKAVIQDNSNVMTFATDPDQGVNIKTISTTAGSGNGNLQITSDNQIGLNSKGNLDVSISSSVPSKNLTLTNQSASGQILLNASAIGLTGVTNVTGNLTVSGDMIVSGTTTTVNTTNLAIADNLVVINSSLVSGTPPANLIGGLEVKRGDSPAYRFVYSELTENFRVGNIGSEQAVATREDSPINGGVANWDTASHQFKTTSLKTGFNLDVGTTAGTLAAGNHTHVADSGKVSTSVTVNGHALSSNVTVTASDVGLGNVTNESKATMFTSPAFTGTVSGGGLGTAAFTASTAYATSAQGTKADAALPASSYTAADVLAKINSANPASQGRYVVAGSGTTMPASPGFADEFYRTDLDEWYKWQGQTWTQI